MAEYQSFHLATPEKRDLQHGREKKIETWFSFFCAWKIKRFANADGAFT